MQEDVVVGKGEDDIDDDVNSLSGPDVLLGDNASDLAGAAEEVLRWASATARAAGLSLGRPRAALEERPVSPRRRPEDEAEPTEPAA